MMNFEKFKAQVQIAAANNTYVVLTVEEGAALVAEIEKNMEFAQPTTTVFGGTQNA